jgi:hypothetical protein
MKEKNNPEGVDFGVNDDVTVAYKEIITSIIFQIPILKCQKRLNP